MKCDTGSSNCKMHDNKLFIGDIEHVLCTGAAMEAQNNENLSKLILWATKDGYFVPRTYKWFKKN